MGTFNDLITHGSIVAYHRKDGTFSFWKVNKKNGGSKDGYFNCVNLLLEDSSATGSSFPIKNLSKVYPIIGCLPYAGYVSVANPSSEVYGRLQFKRFVFSQSSVLVEVVNNAGYISLLSLKDFLDEYILENSVICEL